jgi:hypothetical protein
MKPYLKYGLLAAGTGIIISMLTYLLGMDKTDAGQYIGWINAVVMIIAMIMVIKERRDKELGGYIEFGQAFGTATMTLLIAAAVTAVYTYFYMAVINPSMHDYIIQKQQQGMEEKGLSQEQIDAAMNMTEKFMTPTMMSVFSFLMAMVLGMIIALIIAAIMKKPNPNPFGSPAASES